MPAGTSEPMRILDGIPFAIDRGTVFASLHPDPDGQYASDVHALIDEADRCARPRALYTVAVAQCREPEAVMTAGAPYSVPQWNALRGGVCRWGLPSLAIALDIWSRH